MAMHKGSFLRRVEIIIGVSALALLITGLTFSSIGFQREQEIEATLSLNETGLVGEKGEDGEDGAPGPPGADGRNGTDGAPGPAGAAGINGTDGAPGAAGINGIDGRNGTDGINGIDGRNGTDGINGIDGRNGTDGAPGSMLAGNWSVVASRQTGSTASMLDITIASVSCTTRSASNPVLVSATVAIAGNIYTMIWCNGTTIHQEYRNGGAYMSAGLSRLHVPGVAGTHLYQYVLRSVTGDGVYGNGAADPSTVPWLSFSCIEIVSV